MELFPDNAYFNFGRLRKNKRRAEEQRSASASGSGPRRNQPPPASSSSLDRRLDSSPNIFEVHYDSDIDSQSDAASIASVSTANSDELHKQASKHRKRQQQQQSRTKNRKFRPLGFFRPAKQEEDEQAKDSKTSHVVDVKEEGVANPLSEKSASGTPVKSQRIAAPAPAASPFQKDSVVLNIYEKSPVFKLQTRMESAEFVNYCADHLNKKEKSARKKRGSKFDGAVHDSNHQKEKKGEEEDASASSSRRIKICVAVLAVFVLLAIIAVPVGLLLHNSKGKENSSNLQTGQQPSSSMDWAPESLGGRLATNATATSGAETGAAAGEDEIPFAEGSGNNNNSTGGGDVSNTTAAEAEAEAAAENDVVLLSGENLPQKDIQRNNDWRKCIAAPEFCYELDLHGLDLTGSIPNAVGSLTSLRKLDLSGNLLTGSIPATIGDLANLEQLMLDNNELSGEIPEEVGNLRGLFDLRLHNNHITGEIPGEIGDLFLLEMLSLSRNKLTGEIPASIGEMASLMGVWLQQNQLIGPIPEEIGALSSLQYFWAYDNNLSGGIPKSVTWLPDLVEFKVDERQRAESSADVLEYLRVKLNCLTC
jgi:hypothetical protein